MSAALKAAKRAAIVTACLVLFVVCVGAICIAIMKFGGLVLFGLFAIALLFVANWCAAYGDIKTRDEQ